MSRTHDPRWGARMGFALLFSLALVFTTLSASVSASGTLSRTQWAMYRDGQISVLPAQTPYHGHESVYDFATIPDANNPSWGPAPNGDTVGFSMVSILGAYACRTAVDFTYFQTFVTIPSDTSVTQFTITFSGIDDGVRVSIFNSAYPGGVVVPGSYVFLGGTGTTNLADYVVAGEVNRVVVTQVDDCASGNGLASANVVLNGQVVAPANQPPVVAADAASVTVDEGQMASNTGTYSDPDLGQNVAISASVGTVTKTGTNSGTWSWSNPAPSGPDSYSVTITADDGEASASTSFTVTVRDVPPTLIVGGTATFTEDDAPVVIAPSLSLTDPGNDNIDGARVTIDANFNSAQDSLGIQGQSGASGTVNGLSWSYNSITGVLTLTGPASPATYESALRQVTFSNNSQNPSAAPRTVSFSLGATSLYNAVTGHYYEFVSAPGITWSAARVRAEAKASYGQPGYPAGVFGLQGYLVTITSAQENSFAASKLQGTGWIGASDAASEGTWRWVTGPEAGLHFSNQSKTGWCSANTAPALPGQYANWHTGEPNDCGSGEDYAHFYAGGTWNDYPDNAGANIAGYVVEYGGMPGDPTLQLSGSVTVNVVPVNDPPTITRTLASVTVDEGQTASNTGTYADVDNTDAQLTLAASVGTMTKTGTGTWSWSFDTTDGPAQSQTVTITVDDGDLSAVATFDLVVNNVAPTVTANVSATNTVYYVDWTAANPGAGTASGVINLPNGSAVQVGFEAVNPDGSAASFMGAQTGCGTNYWNPTAPYISAEVPNAPPNCELLQLVGGTNTIYQVTLSEPIVDPIMAIVSLGAPSNAITYNFDSPFSIVSQGVGFFGGCPTCLTQLPGNVLRGAEGHGTIKFLGTFNTFSWTVPTPEVWHGFTFAIRTTGSLGNTNVQEGETATNSGNFFDPGVNDDVTISASVGSITQSAGNSGTWSWSFDTTDGPAQSQTVTITATDKDGASSFVTFPLVVHNVAPTVTADNASVTVDEGQTAANSGTFFDPGVPDNVIITSSIGSVSQDSGSAGAWSWSLGTVDGPADGQTVTITATDKDGASSSVTFGLTVNNVAPTVTADAGSVTVDEGQTAANSGTFFDPGILDDVVITASAGSVSQDSGNSGAWSWSFDAVDGPADGQTVTITATDKDGASSSVTFGLTVNNVAPTVDAGSDAAIFSGQTHAVSATFSDPGVLDAPWTWTINWGDGSSDSGSTTDQSTVITGSHGYLVPGDYTVEVCVTDKDGGTGCDSHTLTVTYLSVLIDIKPGSDPNSINLGHQGSVPVGVFSGTYHGVFLDATTIDRGTVVFAGAPALPIGHGAEDLNGDGLLDRVFHFDTQALNLDADSTQGCLTGVTTDGIYFTGCDTVRIVPPGSPGGGSSNSSNAPGRNR